MTQYANTILIVDDHLHIKKFHKHLGEIFTEWNIACKDDVCDAINFLKDSPRIPQIIFLDAFDRNGTEGYEDFKELSEWLTKNRHGELPEHVVFVSADALYAQGCQDLARRANILPAENIFAVTHPEILKTRLLLDNHHSDGFYGASGWGFNKLANRILGTTLPTSETELDAYLIKHALLREQDAIKFYQEGKLSPLQALKVLQERIKRPLSSANWTHVSPNADTHNHQGLHFKKGHGEDCHGHAAFTMAQARELRLQGKPPILIVDNFKPELYPQLGNLTGIVALKETNPGHLLL